jgi:glutamyl-tRNA synthetase/glutamyl-Q tRNA(Asp) synthetase
MFGVAVPTHELDFLAQQLQILLGGASMRTRFAPSPTGYLHRGHLLNALYVWGLARRLQGRVVLRMEDHDRQRCRPEYETATLDALEHLGFVPDEGPFAEFRAGVSAHRQSDHPEHYEDALQQLADQGLLYGCDCSRKLLSEQAPTDPDTEPRYPGRCRDRQLGLGPGLGIRVRLPERPVPFNDVLLGAHTHTPADQCGDVLLRDRNGLYTYQLCVVVDDLHDGINVVIRGQDLLSSTARQILLGQLLGRPEPPLFLHHPLLLDADGRKLSKRWFQESVNDLMRSTL